MKIQKGIIYTSFDPTQDASLMVQLSESAGEFGNPVKITYLSPQSNSDGGFFSMPTPGSEVLVMHVEPEDDPTGDALGYYYLGSVVGVKTLLGKCVSEEKLEQDWSDSIERLPAFNTESNPLDEPTTIKQTSLGRNDDGSLSISPETAKAWKGKVIIPEKQVWEDPAGNAVILNHQSSFGKNEGFIEESLVLQTGDGKYLKFSDSPAYNLIEMCADKEKINTMVFAGTQTGARSEEHSFANGEFRVNTTGPINMISRDRRINLELQEGYNINILNYSTGDADGSSPEDRNAGKRKPISAGGAYIGNSLYNVGIAEEHPASHLGEEGDPLDKGDEGTGCINIASFWNNINVEAWHDDSVITIYAPGENSKVVVNTGGTVDIIADGKITLTSNTKVELNAPIIDINSGAGVYMD